MPSHVQWDGFGDVLFVGPFTGPDPHRLQPSADFSFNEDESIDQVVVTTVKRVCRWEFYSDQTVQTPLTSCSDTDGWRPHALPWQKT